MPAIHMNWIAIIVAAIVGFVIGGAWYARPLLGNMWLKEIGKTSEDLGPQGLPVAMQGVIILVMAIFLGIFASWTQAVGYKDGLVLGGAVWLGFSATTAAAGIVAEKRSMALFAINSGYHLVALLVMGVIITKWT